MRKQVYETMHKLYANKSDTTMWDTIMNIPSKNKPYFTFPAFDLSCFWPEDTGLAHKVRVYVPFETTMRFTPFVGIIVKRKQCTFFPISDSPQIKPLCRALLSETDICQTMQWIRLNRETLLRQLNGGETRFQRIRWNYDTKRQNVVYKICNRIYKTYNTDYQSVAKRPIL